MSRLGESGVYAVYPRVCGGTLDDGDTSMMVAGLSPRVRGNLPLPPPGAAAGRSIPACAGEPERGHPVAGLRSVYPRVCGGTRSACPAA